MDRQYFGGRGVERPRSPLDPRGYSGGNIGFDLPEDFVPPDHLQEHFTEGDGKEFF